MTTGWGSLVQIRYMVSSKGITIKRISPELQLVNGSAQLTIDQVLNLTKQEAVDKVKEKIVTIMAEARDEIDFYKKLLAFVEGEPLFFNLGTSWNLQKNMEIVSI